MKKSLKILAFLTVVIILIITTIFFYRENIESEGMKITLVGGVNIKENGDRNANGYVIRSASNELIIVDGGEIMDADGLLEYIMKYGNGKVDHWYITHPHADHVGALCELLGREDCNIEIENLYYYFNPLEWYQKYDERGTPSEELMYKSLESSKIINKVICKKDQVIEMDNIKCEILRIANPEIIHSDNGNETSMVFKMTDVNTNKSILFLGDAFEYTSEELLKEPEKLSSYAVQMAHHGQNGVTKSVYDAINPKVCFFNAPKWLYDNDNGNGYNSGNWKSVVVRDWVNEYGADSFCGFDGNQTIRFTKTGYEILDENDNVIEEKIDSVKVAKVDNTKSYIFRKEQKEIKEVYYDDNVFEDKINLPFVNINSEDATKVNTELKNRYDEATNSLVKDNDSGFSFTSMDYESKIISGKYASLMVLQMPVYVPGGDFEEYYSIYNFDLENGKLLSKKEIIDRFNLTEEMLEQKLKDDLIERYVEYGDSEYEFGTLEQYLQNSKYNFENIEIYIAGENRFDVYLEFPVGPEGIRTGKIEIEM